jgi:hypothetical protein
MVIPTPSASSKGADNPSSKYITGAIRNSQSGTLRQADTDVSLRVDGTQLSENVSG